MGAVPPDEAADEEADEDAELPQALSPPPIAMARSAPAAKDERRTVSGPFRKLRSLVGGASVQRPPIRLSGAPAVSSGFCLFLPPLVPEAKGA